MSKTRFSFSSVRIAKNNYIIRFDIVPRNDSVSNVHEWIACIVYRVQSNADDTNKSQVSSALLS